MQQYCFLDCKVKVHWDIDEMLVFWSYAPKYRTFSGFGVARRRQLNTGGASTSNQQWGGIHTPRIGLNTCLLIVFKTNVFPEEYVPTVFENHVIDVHLDGREIQLALWDTAGQEEYDRLRPLSYPGAHVVLICFSIASPDSLENVETKWIPEVQHHCPGLPILLVGCKMDLRNDPVTIRDLGARRQAPVSPEQGLAMARKIGAYRYLECSAKSREGVFDVFEHATRASLVFAAPTKVAVKKKCLLL
ncbi:GTP-binding protein Rho1 [Phlyctochytrium planicorne]|nr:GTP-binding protein Rho1 [Phlyctochytrium planicorne]